MRLRERRAARTGGQRGSVLLPALTVVIGISALSVALLQMSTSLSRQQVMSVDNKRAFYMAEAGLSEAVYGLNVGKNGNVGTQSMPASYGEGLFWVEATGQPDGRVLLESTGLCGTGRYRLSLFVEQESKSIGSLGIFADEDMTVGGGTLIDSYDSRLGTYESQLEEPREPLGGLFGENGVMGEPKAGDAKLASNEDITIVASKSPVATRIDGDVTPGPAGTVLADEGVVITGSTLPSTAEVDLPSIVVPSLADRGMVIWESATPKLVPTGEGSYSKIKVKTGGTVVLQGPSTFTIEKLIAEPGGTFVFDTTGGPITLYVTSWVDLRAQSLLVCENPEPATLAILITASETLDQNSDGVDDPPVTIQSTGAYYGVVYAPSAPVSIASDFELFGSLAAKQLSLLDDARVHYDVALGASTSIGATGSPEAVCWRIMDLPPALRRTQLLDPRVALDLVNVKLPPPDKAHQEVLWKIEYINILAQTVRWSGKEADFPDWANVVTVLNVAREGDANFNLF